VQVGVEVQVVGCQVLADDGVVALRIPSAYEQMPAREHGPAMLLEPEALASLPTAQPSRGSVLGGALLSLLASLFGTSQSGLSTLGLALLRASLLEVALCVLVHGARHFERDAGTGLAVLVGEEGDDGALDGVDAVDPRHIH